MASRDLGTYQMLWNCPFCGTEKLLALTHRHCPSCGAPQDPANRYFPSEADKVAVEDHRFSGSDKICPSCQAPNGAAASHCGTCGAELDGAKEAGRVADRVASAEAGQSLEAQKKAERKAAQQLPEPPKQKGGRGCLIVGCLVLVVLVVVALVATLWTREATMQVTGHTWSRVVAVERYGSTDASSWCDEMPPDARSVSHMQKQRSTNKVADGEECHTKQVDNGDGTFKEVEDCQTKYRSETVYGDWCSYTVDRWKRVRDETASGSDLSPRWPEVRLGQTGTCIGCEREGTKTQTYTVLFKDPQGDRQTCDLPEDRWKSMADGSRWAARVRVMTGGLDCGELKPAR